MFDQILLPTDGSDAVAPAVETALDVARTYGATLHVLYVVEPPASASGAIGGATSMDDVLEGIEQEGRQAIEEVVDRTEAQGVETETAVQRGNPRDDILAYAENHEIDLIVIGTHGRTGVKRTLLGSVSETVVRHSDVPVLTVHRDPSN